MIRVVHPGSLISDPDADFFPSRIPDPGVKKAPNPGSRIRIRNTGFYHAKSLFIAVNVSLCWLKAKIGQFYSKFSKSIS
jgi:hypothetical protein